MTLLDDDREVATIEIEDKVLGKPDIDARYAALRASVADHRDGLFGPGSMFWRMLEPLPVLPFMLINAGLLEGAAPKIWFGTEYSVTRTGDFGSRYARSYDAFADWFLGDVETALRRGRKIHGYHSRVGGVAPHSIGHVQAGQEYRATEQQLMLFTVGTQIVPIKDFYERFYAPLTPAEADRYWDECKRFCSIFGIDPAVVPETWADFEAYWNGCLTSGEMAVPTEGYSRYGPLIDQTGMPFVSKWLVRWIMAVQFNLLPDSLRSQFEPIIPLAKARPRLTAASCFGFKWLVRALPAGLRTTPRVQAARRRAGVAGRQGRIERWLVATLPHPFGDKLPSLNTPASAEADPANSQAFRRPAV